MSGEPPGVREGERDSAAQPALVLDCRGMRCPRPVIELARHIGDVEIEALVAVMADDPAAAVDIPAWCRLRGHEYVGERYGGQNRRTEGEPTERAPSYLVRRLASALDVKRSRR